MQTYIVEVQRVMVSDRQIEVRAESKLDAINAAEVVAEELEESGEWDREEYCEEPSYEPITIDNIRIREMDHHYRRLRRIWNRCQPNPEEYANTYNMGQVQDEMRKYEASNKTKGRTLNYDTKGNWRAEK